MKSIRSYFSEIVFNLIVFSLTLTILISCGGAEQANESADITSEINVSPTPTPSGPSQEQIE